MLRAKCPACGLLRTALRRHIEAECAAPVQVLDALPGAGFPDAGDRPHTLTQSTMLRSDRTGNYVGRVAQTIRMCYTCAASRLRWRCANLQTAASTAFANASRASQGFYQSLDASRNTGNRGSASLLKRSVLVAS